MAGAELRELDPVGRGWITASLVALTVLVLFVARSYGAGAYGAGAVPFLLLFFVLNGIVAARAITSVLRRVWRPLALVVAWAVGALVAAVALQTWNTTPSSEPLLTRMFLVLLVPAVAWAAVAPARTRVGAWVTAAVAIVGFLVARQSSL